MPVEWRDLVAQSAEDTSESVAFFEETIPQLGMLGGMDLTRAFAGSSTVLGGGMALCGTARTRVFVRGFHPHLRRVVAELSAQNRRDTSLAHWIVNFALLSECMGVPRPQGFDNSLLKPLVTKVREFDDARQRAMAFTALALGDTALALEFVDAQPAKYDAPVLHFEFNQLELIRYLAAAIDRDRPADWIEPAWVEYFRLFPLHISAQAAEWPDLFNFARVLANLRGDKVVTLADDIHARVMMAAQSQT